MKGKTMPTKLADTRELTLDDARKLHEKIANLEIELAVQQAHAERRIAKLKAEYQQTVAPTLAERDRLAQDLANYILFHPEEFTRPRAIRTELGRFGRRAVSNVKLLDTDEVISWAQSYGYDDALKITYRPVKPAIAKRIRAGEDVPGAEMIEGEEAFYIVDRALLDAAKKKA